MRNYPLNRDNQNRQQQTHKGLMLSVCQLRIQRKNDFRNYSGINLLGLKLNDKNYSKTLRNYCCLINLNFRKNISGSNSTRFSSQLIARCKRNSVCYTGSPHNRDFTRSNLFRGSASWSFDF